MSKLGNMFRELENTLQTEVELNIRINQNVQTNTTKINFNICEIKTLKRMFKDIKINTNQKNIKIEEIERIKIENKPEPTKHEINMTKVVNEFKNIDITTHLIKVPENILNISRPKTDRNAYKEFKLKELAEV